MLQTIEKIQFFHVQPPVLATSKGNFSPPPYDKKSKSHINRSTPETPVVLAPQSVAPFALPPSGGWLVSGGVETTGVSPR